MNGVVMNDDLSVDDVCKELDISQTNLEIYLEAAIKGISVKDIAKKFGISENNVYVIKCRVGKLFAKYGKNYFNLP